MRSFFKQQNPTLRAMKKDEAKAIEAKIENLIATRTRVNDAAMKCIKTADESKSETIKTFLTKLSTYIFIRSSKDNNLSEISARAQFINEIANAIARQADYRDLLSEANILQFKGLKSKKLYNICRAFRETIEKEGIELFEFKRASLR